MGASFNLTELLNHPKTFTGALIQRRHIVIWLIVASELLTAFQMREGFATLIVLTLNAALLFLAVTLFKNRQVAIWLAVAAEIGAATQMAPDKATAIALLINAALLALTIVAARLSAQAQSGK